MNDRDTGKADISGAMACFAALLCWSVGPIFVKLLSDHLDFWTQNLLRYLVACLFWLPVLIIAIRSGRVKRRLWKLAILPAAVNVVAQCLWAKSFYYLDPAFMVLLSKVSVFWVAVFAMVFFAEERALIKSPWFWMGLLFGVIGLTGVLVHQSGFGTKVTLTGIAVALCWSFSWGVYTVTIRTAFRNTDSRIGFSIISIYTVAGLFVLEIFFGNYSAITRLDLRLWFYIIFSGLFSIAFAHVLYYAAMRRLGATIPSVALLATPFTVAAISNMVFEEKLEPLQWLFGTILIVGAALAIRAGQTVKKSIDLPAVTDN